MVAFFWRAVMSLTPLQTSRTHPPQSQQGDRGRSSLHFRTQDPGPRTQDPGPRTQDPGLRTRMAWARTKPLFSSVAPSAQLAVRGEGVMLGALLVLALVARIVRLDSLEPNLLPDEADHLSILYHVLAGYGPGLFDLSWDGNPAASLYPALPLLQLLG